MTYFPKDELAPFEKEARKVLKECGGEMLEEDFLKEMKIKGYRKPTFEEYEKMEERNALSVFRTGGHTSSTTLIRLRDGPFPWELIFGKK